ncbi:type II toxin-antitoxin system RelE/ParE family toxin [Desulfosporosinus sp. BICA1-9]|uniref:type II toxin-antitoxin system RelE family toxin n=1 Tax=Desulfosporosinus sp. BICA1-9 TaxID=1531958 RepID=UPI00054B8AA7|nr:type II toxin-antitoxin system RelE/ParE family toxin [Desulfosporosinus sp. BICA1-9]KJS82452.1 MAG: toxin RelE [Desulfosporosinus sp. BICA1-9]HBW37548.1 addiction module toxin RelE [Desulfosporosinus sp.]
MWKVEYLRESLEDIKRLDHSQRLQVVKAINKVAVNPLPQAQGGYRKPLSNKSGTNLAGYCKIKLLRLGLRIVYKVVRENNIMKIVVVSARADDEVYILAQKRIEQ